MPSHFSQDEGLSDADLWEKKFREFGSEEKATAYVEMRRGLHGDRPVVAPPKPVLPGALNALLQGASFGFSDDILGTLRGIVDPNATMAQGREAARTGIQQFRGDHPVLAPALEFAGSLPTSGGIVGAAGKAALKQGLPRLAKLVVKALASNTGVGAVAGAGAAEGGVVERVKGAAAGGILGGATSLGLRAVSGLGGKILDAIHKRPLKPIRGLPIKSKSEKADERILRTLKVDQATLPGIAARAKETPTPMLLEQGETTLDLAKQNITRAGRRNLAESLEPRIAEMKTQLRTIANDIYAPAYAKSVSDPRISELMRTKEFRAAYKVGQRIAMHEVRAKIPGATLLPDLPAQLPDDHVFPVRAIDYMKQGMDELIEQGAKGGKGPKGRVAAFMRKQLEDVKAIADGQAEYAEARATYGKASKEIGDAVERQEELIKASRGRSQEERVALASDHDRVTTAAANLGAGRTLAAAASMMGPIEQSMKDPALAGLISQRLTAGRGGMQELLDAIEALKATQSRQVRRGIPRKAAAAVAGGVGGRMTNQR